MTSAYARHPTHQPARVEQASRKIRFMHPGGPRLWSAVAIVVAMIGPAAASAFDPGLEARNFAKTEERMQ